MSGAREIDALRMLVERSEENISHARDRLARIAPQYAPPDWRSLCAQLAEALRYAHRWMDTEGHECGVSTTPEGCPVDTALTAYDRATGNRPNSSESSPGRPGVGESGGEER